MLKVAVRVRARVSMGKHLECPVFLFIFDLLSVCFIWKLFNRHQVNNYFDGVMLNY